MENSGNNSKTEDSNMEKELGIDVARDKSIPDGEAKKCHPYRWIDKDMLTIKLGYAFHFAALGAWLPLLLSI